MIEQQERKEKSTPAKRLHAFRKGFLTGKLARFSLKSSRFKPRSTLLQKLVDPGVMPHPARLQ